MPYDHISENYIFLATAQPPRSTQGTIQSLAFKTKILLDLAHTYCFSVCIHFSAKNIDNIFSYGQLKYLTFDPSQGIWGVGVNSDTVVIIYRHWAIMAHSENLFETIILGKCEVPYTKSQYSSCIIIIRYIKQETLVGDFGPRVIV